MNALQRWTVGAIIGVTNSPIDWQRNKAALAYGRAIGFEHETKRMIIDARAVWKVRQILTQRRWQQLTRRSSRAVHHDSIELREKYVRTCQG